MKSSTWNAEHVNAGGRVGAWEEAAVEPPEAVPLLTGEQAVQGSRKMQPTVVGIHISLPSPVQRPLGRVVEGGPSSLPRWQTRV